MDPSASPQKRVDRWTVGQCNLPGNAPFLADAFRPWVFLVEDLTAERPIRDIARTHEAVINVAPDAAVPLAAALAGDCILKVGIAVALAHDFPRERRADPRE